jgi:diguanylate cyclase (GGDEF)-like protein
MPFKDPVTEMFNKDFFFTRLDLAMARTNRRSDFLFAITIFQHNFTDTEEDHFEPDPTLEILRQVANRLRTYLRPTDTLARLSGWKFATLHEELKHPDDIEVIIKRIHNELSKPYEIGGDTFQLTINYGGVVYHPVYKKAEDLFTTSEKALNQALTFDQAGLYALLTKPSLGFRTNVESRQ